ncbi:MAG: transposase [Emergencia sp.]
MSNKHLTFDDRLAIQTGLQKGHKVAQIAKNIGKDRSTVGREIKSHRRLVTSSGGNSCAHRNSCNRIPDCRLGCHRGKKQCQTACGGCNDGCPDYQEEFCPDYERTPFVCNACKHRLRCRLRRMLYDAKHAQQQYEEYLEYLNCNPDAMVSQMDTVVIHPGGQAILTILLMNCDLQLMFLRQRNTARSVTEIFSRLREILSDDEFRTLFQVILTDRGTEFSDPGRIESDPDTGEVQCHVFYCNPMNTNQKSNCERNHEFIRYIIPKKCARDDYTEEEIRKMMNHINSYPRKKWNGQAPIDLFIKIYGKETATLLGLEKIPSDSIHLTPALLKR